ncbi:MAG: HAMP domain-containing histidine kinase [Bacteroidales bacterium]|nr:HAMP domain-containing histidine kinase [Bacteroidales bacterium]
MNIYSLRRYGTWAFLLLAVVAVALFLIYSQSLVNDLAEQERARMQIWADATQQIASEGGSNDEQYLDFLLGIIEGNRTIPVILTNQQGDIVMHRNFNLPEPPDSLNPLFISEANKSFLAKKLTALRAGDNVIDIEIAPGLVQKLYYEDSSLLRSLSRFPYVQIAMMLAFIIVVYCAVTATKRAEQNKVWVGLSKETAHQLGTPISSLMAWVELLRSMGVDEDMLREMNKDVNRLAAVASRFSKIGSKPRLEEADLRQSLSGVVEYMRSRISQKIELGYTPSSESLCVKASTPLLEWVMENLIKNAVDAMPQGQGSIQVASALEGNQVVIEVTDSGKGISRRDQKSVFKPGFTTKTRGWGLGLTLARRIVEQYHRGHIFVKWSEPGVGTTFRIELPQAQ